VVGCGLRQAGPTPKRNRARKILKKKTKVLGIIYIHTHTIGDWNGKRRETHWGLLSICWNSTHTQKEEYGTL
jgi:hypothetical protein